MRATERQRGSGQQRPAWPGNAVTACVAGERRSRHGDITRRCERRGAASSSMRATERQRASGQQRPAWPGNAVTACVAGERRGRHGCTLSWPASPAALASVSLAVLTSGNAQHERRALALLRRHEHLATMVRRDVAHDRQAESGAARVAAATLVDAVEPLEDPGVLRRRDADALVGHHQLGEGALHTGADLHPPTDLGVLDGVLDEVPEGGDQLAAVAPHPPVGLTIEHRDLDAAAPRRAGRLAPRRRPRCR